MVPWTVYHNVTVFWPHVCSILKYVECKYYGNKRSAEFVRSLLHIPMKANLISLWFVSTNAVNRITFLFTIPRKMCLHSNNNNNVTRYSFFNVCGCVGARAFPEIELNKIPSCTFINPVGIRKLINSYPRLLHNRDPYTHPSTC